MDSTSKGKEYPIENIKQTENDANGTVASDMEAEESAALRTSKQLSTKKALWSWLLLCYSTGPTGSMTLTYVPAVVQSMANLLGHQPGSAEPCAKRGNINCVVRFGAGEVNYNSYVLYLSAIARACDGIVTILVSGVADYSNYRRLLMMSSIILFGALALPFAGLVGRSYADLIAVSVLWVAMSTIQGVYATMESSYIPQFMRAAGLLTLTRARTTKDDVTSGEVAAAAAAAAPPPTEAEATRSMYNRGSRVSVFGLVAGNLGSITALLTGIVISYTRGTGVFDGYTNFLIAITVAGCTTVVLGATGGALVPSIRGSRPPTGNLLALTLRRWVRLLRCLPRYPETFKFVVGWILWNTAYSNFLTLVSLLFREVWGIGTGDALYTVWTCTAVIFASCGSLTWGFVFPHMRLGIKTWAYIFLGLNALCVFWGCLGISNNVPIGYKKGPEFWVEQVIFMSTSSALRATNRVIYASIIPEGHEAQFFGLELTLDLATGWISPLVTGSIQDAASNLRVPMVINLALMGIAAGLYWWTDLDKGRQDTKKPMQKH